MIVVREERVSCWVCDEYVREEGLWQDLDTYGGCLVCRSCVGTNRQLIHEYEIVFMKNRFGFTTRYGKVEDNFN